jgi:hypothetical protein
MVTSLPAMTSQPIIFIPELAIQRRYQVGFSAIDELFVERDARFSLDGSTAKAMKSLRLRCVSSINDLVVQS